MSESATRTGERGAMRPAGRLLSAEMRSALLVLKHSREKQAAQDYERIERVVARRNVQR
jgi:hypothetical protein